MREITAPEVETRPGQHLAILVVSSDPWVCSVTDWVLQPEGYTLIRTGDSQQALMCALLFGPDLIVLHLPSGEFSESGLLEGLHSRPELRGIPCLAVSCDGSELTARRLRVAGFVGVIPLADLGWRLRREVERVLSAHPGRQS